MQMRVVERDGGIATGGAEDRAALDRAGGHGPCRGVDIADAPRQARVRRLLFTLLSATVGVRPLVFTSGSMAPAIETGDLENDQGWKRIIGTCHVWDPEGDAVKAREDGSFREIPVFLQRRLDALGRSTPAS